MDSWEQNFEVTQCDQHCRAAKQPRKIKDIAKINVDSNVLLTFTEW